MSATAEGVLLRRADDADWPAIWPIWHAVVTAGDTYAYEPALSSDQARREWLAPPPHEAWVAEIGGRAVGTYHLGPNHRGPGSHIANASYMVDAGARGRGIGRVMVQHSIERGREAGFLGLQFNAVAATNVHAIKLYEDFGFVTVGVVPRAFRHPTEGLVGLHVMYLEL